MAENLLNILHLISVNTCHFRVMSSRDTRDRGETVRGRVGARGRDAGEYKNVFILDKISVLGTNFGFVIQVSGCNIYIHLTNALN